VAATPPLPLLAEQVPHVASPRLRVTVDEVAACLASLNDKLAAVKAELERSSSEAAANGGTDGSSGGGGGSGGGSGAALQAVAADLDRQLAGAEQLLQECREGFAATAAYFGESAAALSSEQELWGEVQRFVDAFSTAQRALVQQQEEEAARQRRQRSSVPSSAPKGSNGRLGGDLHPAAACNGSASSARQAANRTAAASQQGGQAAAPDPQPEVQRQQQQEGALPPPTAIARQLDFPSPDRLASGAPPAASSPAAPQLDMSPDTRRLQQLLLSVDSGSDPDT
jgi:hypothetical protein